VNAVINRKTKLIDLGLQPYKETWDYQTDLFNTTLAIKSGNRDIPAEDQKVTPNYVILCEHPHVYTLGKNGKENNLLLDMNALDSIGASYFQINRGGDITYHGPGQLVCYPIVDLDNFFTDIHKYMRCLEEAVIKTLHTFGIEAGRIAGLTGVWVDIAHPENARKICALGVKTSRWVTMHGLALNVNADLTYFDNIIACGITDKSVTSMSKELGAVLDIKKVGEVLKDKMAEEFGFEWI
jgi:lipoyl(octanoyl) transferase